MDDQRRPADVEATADPAERIEALGREVYGERYEAFLDTPRRSLGLATPRAMLKRGDHEPVMRLLAKTLNGEWA